MRMAAVFEQIAEFDELKEEWPFYAERLEQYPERRNLYGRKIRAILCDHKPIAQNKFHIYFSLRMILLCMALLSHKLIPHK